MNYLAIFIFLVISSANGFQSLEEDNESGYGFYEELLPKEPPSPKKNQSARGIWEGELSNNHG